MFRLMLCALLWLGLAMLAAGAGGKSYSPTDLKNPMLGPKESAFCGRPGVERSAICDPDNLMTKESKDVIEGTINKIKNAEVAVVMIDSMSSYFQMFRSVDSSAEKFARAVHDSWGVGDRNTNNGVLVFLSISDRAWYVSTGEGVQDRLYGETIDQVMDHAKGKLRSNDVGGAVEGIITELEIILEKPASGKFVSIPSKSKETSWSVPLIFVAIFFAMGYFQDSRKDEMKKGKVALDQLLTEVRDLHKNNKFHSNSCPICLEDFVSEEGAGAKIGDIVSLHCGHIYCRNCITSHISAGGDKCPICRQTIDRKLINTAQSNVCSGWGCWLRGRLGPPSYPSSSHSHRHREVLFRLHRIRSRYPSVMTEEAHNDLAGAVASNSLDQFIATGESRSTAIGSELIALQKTGSKGSSRSKFGGGKSSGGRGGRW
jgi:uncharacterized membrane protein YgcG